MSKQLKCFIIKEHSEEKEDEEEEEEEIFLSLN